MKCLSCLDYRIPTLLSALAASYVLQYSVVRGAGPDPEVLIQNLEQSQTSGQAYRDLLAMGDRAVPFMIAGLESPNKDVRRLLASLLGETRSEEAIAPLVRMAQSKEYSDLSSALNALGRIGGPEAAEAFIATLPRLHPSGQESSCRVLSAIGDSRAIEPLIKLLASRDSTHSRMTGGLSDKGRVRQASAEALGRFRDPRARAALVRTIQHDPEWDVYHAAMRALYRMDNETSYPGYDRLAATVVLAVAKQPEPPSGAEEFVRNWHEEHRNGPAPWVGPRLEDFASQVDIERARNAVVETGKTWKSDHHAGGVVALLMEYLCNQKFRGEPENAKRLLVRIGKSAIPALENGVKRGDMVLVRNCQQCIEKINSAESGGPANGNQPIQP